jgi:hypothetical protein
VLIPDPAALPALHQNLMKSVKDDKEEKATI